MILFITLFIFICFFALAQRFNYKIGVIELILMGLINAFRGEKIGSDTINYYNNNFYGDSTIDFSSSYDLEWIFQSVSRFITVNHLDPRWCLYFLSIVTFTFLLLSINRLKKNYGLSITLFLLFYFISGIYPQTFNISRQLAATSIILYAYTFLNDTKSYKFFIWCLIAAGIHLSSLICVIAYLFRYFNLTKINFTLICIAISLSVVIALMLKDFFLNFLFSNFPAIGLYDNLVGATETSESRSIFGLIHIITKVTICVYVYKNITINPVYKSLFLFTIFVSIYITIFYGNISRLAYGFNIFQITIITIYFSKKALNQIDWVGLICYIGVTGYPMLKGLSNEFLNLDKYYMTLP